ncbi:SRPBCC domain-containing protein [Glycomyces terrestris]|uniref:Polyketide cyclase n=1 Tax=Glycomyces terrestris TaxID=2493553 RepID=A0A426UT73_9ACTN|nr:SRPBCC domain-containing protein [Glycomyces terrestris]RRR96853.1 polyketide cyclase [Glycomyces terrestris]
MEYASIEREIRIEAAPAVVFEVVSSPEHLKQWWADEAEFAPVAGDSGRIGFHQDGGAVAWERFTVVDAQPPRLFSFRWTHADGEEAAPGNSFLVVFELEPEGAGTILRMTETGFRERGWSEAVAAQHHADHVSGWDFFLPRLPAVAEKAAR